MEFVGQSIKNLENYADPRVANWLGMSSPFPTIAISLTYVSIVKVTNWFSINLNLWKLISILRFKFFGPKIMKNRKPFQLRKIIIVYNFFQVLLSVKIFHDGSKYAWFLSGADGYNWRCQNVDRSPTGLPLLVRLYKDSSGRFCNQDSTSDCQKLLALLHQ